MEIQHNWTLSHALKSDKKNTTWNISQTTDDSQDMVQKMFQWIMTII